MENNKEYKNIKKKYLAYALSFMGFRYMIFNREDGKKEYAFENTDNFQMALNGLLQLKKQIDDNI